VDCLNCFTVLCNDRCCCSQSFFGRIGDRLRDYLTPSFFQSSSVPPSSLTQPPPLSSAAEYAATELSQHPFEKDSTDLIEVEVILPIECSCLKWFFCVLQKMLSSLWLCPSTHIEHATSCHNHLMVLSYHWYHASVIDRLLIEICLLSIVWLHCLCLIRFQESQTNRNMQYLKRLWWD